MSVSKHSGLSEQRAPVMMQVCVITALCLLADCAFAQQQPQGKRDDLDVTMQIIVDPDAKLPEEIVRRIPLPARNPAGPRAASSSEQSDQPAKQPSPPDRSAEERELGHEMSERARERRQDAAEQREEARRSAAEERRRRDRGRPEDPPGRPRPPPRR